LVTEVDDIYRGISRFNKAQVPIVNGPGRRCSSSRAMSSPSKSMGSDG